MDNVSYWLGKAHALITQAREHMIRNEDVPGLELIENGYIELEKGLGEIIRSEIDGKK